MVSFLMDKIWIIGDNEVNFAPHILRNVGDEISGWQIEVQATDKTVMHSEQHRRPNTNGRNMTKNTAMFKGTGEEQDNSV